jgi:hypothetical protein
VRNAHMAAHPDPYLEWVRQGLKKPGKSQSGLARHLGLDPSAINKLVNGKRILKGPEIGPTAEYLEEPPPALEPMATVNGSITRPSLDAILSDAPDDVVQIFHDFATRIKTVFAKK